MWKIHGTNFFHIKFLDHTYIKCQNEPVLPPAQVFYFNGQVFDRLHFSDFFHYIFSTYLKSYCKLKHSLAAMSANLRHSN
jgi:hypothetical protein